MCSKPIFCSKIALKGKTCSRLLKPQKVAPNAKSCSKVAEHNRDRPTRRSGPEILDFSMVGAPVSPPTPHFHHTTVCTNSPTLRRYRISSNNSRPSINRLLRIIAPQPLSPFSLSSLSSYKLTPWMTKIAEVV